MSTAWTSRYAQRAKAVKSSAIRELLKITQRPEVISFAGGLPAPDVFPAGRFREACCQSWKSSRTSPSNTAPPKATSPCAK